MLVAPGLCDAMESNMQVISYSNNFLFVFKSKRNDLRLYQFHNTRKEICYAVCIPALTLTVKSAPRGPVTLRTSLSGSFW